MGSRRLSERLTYANVVATIALFVALSGASYAAISLPSGSVGTRALAFPLGVASSTAQFTQRLSVQECGIDESCPAPLPTTFRSVSIDLKHTARLLVLGSATMGQASATNSPVEVDLTAERSNADAGATTAQVGEQSSPMQFWQVVTAPAGHQILKLQAWAQSGASTDRTILVNIAQLDVVVLPGLN